MSCIDFSFYYLSVHTFLAFNFFLYRYLFWSDNGKHPKIERSDLKGENRHTIVSKHLKSPISIETDVIDKRIYWIDESSILSATYKGRDIISVRRIPESSLFDLATFRVKLF